MVMEMLLVSGVASTIFAWMYRLPFGKSCPNRLEVHLTA